MGKNSRLKKERRQARKATQLTDDDTTYSTAQSAVMQPECRVKTAAASLSLVILHTVTIVALCFALGIFPIESEDIFANILTGQYLWSAGKMPSDDPFSFTGPFSWKLNGPLATLVLYGVHSVGGLPAVQLFCIGLVALTYSLLYLVWARRIQMPTLVFSVVAVAICASCFWFQTRVYIFAYVYIATSLLLITSSNPRYMLWAIPLQIVWINSHPSAVLGLFFTGVWWFHSVWRAKRFEGFASSILLGVVLANVVSPNGVGSFRKFAEEFFAQHPSRAQIYEWFSPFHPLIRDQHLAQWFFGLSIVSVAVLWSVLTRFSRIRVAPILLPIAAIFFLMSLGCARHIPIFYFAMVGLAVCGLQAAIKDSFATSRGSSHRSTLARTFIPIALCWGIVLWVFLYGYANGEARRRLAFGIDTRKFPERAIQLVTKAQVGGNVFTEYGMSAYFLYRTFPKYKVYIDSARLDEVYGEDWFMRYMRIGNYPDLLKQDIERFDMRTFILPIPATRADIVPIYRFLSTDPGWRLAFFDEGSMVYVSAQEAAARGIPTYQKLNPLVDMGDVLKKDPSIFAALAQDFSLGDTVNPDSRPFLMLKSWFQRTSKEALAAGTNR
jgi:hypothetical protein